MMSYRPQALRLLQSVCWLSLKAWRQVLSVVLVKNCYNCHSRSLRGWSLEWLRNFGGCWKSSFSNMCSLKFMCRLLSTQVLVSGRTERYQLKLLWIFMLLKWLNAKPNPWLLTAQVLSRNENLWLATSHRMKLMHFDYSAITTRTQRMTE